jgi:hypothetical protein
MKFREYQTNIQKNQKTYQFNVLIDYNCSVPVTHTSNGSYSGGRDQEDRSLKPALGK